MKNLSRTHLTSLFFFSLDVAFGKTLTWVDLAYSGGLYYKKFSKVTFSLEIMGKSQGKIKNGKKEGTWIEYENNGQMLSKLSQHVFLLCIFLMGKIYWNKKFDVSD